MKLYRLIISAEKARMNKDHSKMVECRKNLKELSPSIFEGYLERIRTLNLILDKKKIMAKELPIL